MAKRLVQGGGRVGGDERGGGALGGGAGDVSGPVVTVLPDAWDRYRTTPWIQAWAT